MIHAAGAADPADEIPLDIVFTTKGKGPFRGPLPERTGYPPGGRLTPPPGEIAGQTTSRTSASG
jgi:hypothetical protein